MRNVVHKESGPENKETPFLTDKGFLVLLGLFFAIGTVLRVYRLTYFDLWYDEVFSIIHAFNITYFLQHLHFSAEQPLYYIFLKAWISLWGESALAVRTFSVLAGVAAIPLIYKVGSSLYGKTTGLLSSFLLAVSPLHIWYSREARNWSLSVCMALGIVYVFMKASASGLKRWWILGILLALFGCYLDYFLLFVIVPVMAYALFHLKIPVVKRIVIMFLSGIVLVPLAVLIMTQIRFLQGGFWIPVPGFTSFLIVLGNFIVGYTATAEVTLAAAALVAALLIFWIVRSQRDSRYSLLLSLTILPMLFIYLFSQYVPVFLTKTCIVFLPFFFISLSNAMMRMGPFLRRCSIWVVPFLVVSPLANYYNGILPASDYFHVGVPAPVRFRNAVAYIHSHLKAGDKIMHSNFHTLPPFLYYLESSGIHQFYFTVSGKQTDYFWKRISAMRYSYADRPRWDIKIAQDSDKKEWSGERIWLVRSSWKIDGTLDHHSHAVRSYMQQHFTLLKTTYIDGMYIDLYSAGAL